MRAAPLPEEETMNGFPIAIALHLVAITVWIGGVGFVTLALLPGIRRDHPPDKRLAVFLRIEDRFVWPARAAVLLAGGSGYYMVAELGLEPAFADPHFWWLHAMLCLWLVFAAMLFLIEPLFLHRRLAATPHPARAFRRMEILHRTLFALSLLTVFGGAAGSHGL